jgi:hypothetical protein
LALVGSQGVVRQINTDTTTAGITYCTSTIVEFPTCKAIFPDLPPHCFPITPILWTFATKINGELIRVTRHQLPIQPAFAVTGHSAQGKTLPNVLVNLHEGGFAAYVAASRPTSRKGLCITKPVTLEMLNKPLPYDLLIEDQRFQIMEANTLVGHGFKKGTIKDVFDPEAETDMSPTTIHSTFEFLPTKTNTKKHQKRALDKDIDRTTDVQTFKKVTHPTDITSMHGIKRKLENQTIIDSSTSDTPHKKIKTTPNNVLNINTDIPVLAGCKWSVSDWSCSYDVFFMIFYHMHVSAPELWKIAWSTFSPLS